MRPNSLSKTVGDLKLQALINELHQSLAEVEAEKRGDTLHDMQADALANTLADNLEEVNAGKISDTLKDLKVTSPVVSLAPKVAEIKAKTAAKKNTMRYWSDTGCHAFCHSSRGIGKDI